MSAKLAAHLAAFLVIASSLAYASINTEHVGGYASELQSLVEQNAASVPLATSRLLPIPSNGRFAGELTMREGYSAAQGPGIECGACSDPCRSFSLAITVIGGNGRLIGDACLTAGGWRVINMSEQSWVSQPTSMAPPLAPETVPLGNISISAASQRTIVANLRRLNYISAQHPSAGEFSGKLDRLLADEGLPPSAVSQDDADQFITNLLTRTNEAITRSTAPSERCAPPASGGAGGYLMCGRVANN